MQDLRRAGLAASARRTAPRRRPRTWSSATRIAPGALAGDDALRVAHAGGDALHNTGNWVFQTLFMGRAQDGSSPYWPGGAIVLEDDGPPRLERLLGDVPAKALRPASPR